MYMDIPPRPPSARERDRWAVALGNASLLGLGHGSASHEHLLELYVTGIEPDRSIHRSAA
ncbi:hypothetical protein ABIA39_003396 [Nocardia sp. GAS34]|jgi:hypothetical protein|uniref:hypothetical protein n=1 Tax=unclassified Nocardia TaxID=2637762 RepID=UPI003D254DCC